MRHFLEIFPRLLLSVLLLAAISGSLSAQGFDQLPPPNLDEPPLMGDLGGGFGDDEDVNPVTIHAVITPPDADRPVYLCVTADLLTGWHIYSTTQTGDGPLATKIKINPNPSIKSVGAGFVSPAPKRSMSEGFGFEVENHEDTVTWFMPLELHPGTDLKTLAIEGSVFAQPCKEACLPPSTYRFKATLATDPKNLSSLLGIIAKMTGAVNNVTKPPVPGTETNAKAPSSTSDKEPESASSGGSLWDKIEDKAEKDKPKGSLLINILFGFLGGLILNVMPCVLPVIGLKIMSFIEQAGHDRRHAFMLNVWYSCGLMSVFLLLAVLSITLGLGWGGLLRYGGVNLVLIAVVFVMALSFLGTWEIPIPGFVGSGKAEAMSRKEGVAGAFTKGALTTVLATPCSAPFLAPALFWMATQPPVNVFAVFIAIGLGMSSPYLLIGAFPKLIKFLPKPGAWMETFKQVMGFVLLGTVIFLMMSTEQEKLLPVITFLFGLWAACWWIGKISILAPVGKKLLHWGEAIAFSVLIWFLAFSVLAPEQGPASTAKAENVQTSSSSEQPWTEFTKARLDKLVKEKRTVLVDFTADWCATCKTLEKLVLDSESVQDAIREHKVVTLRADWTHEGESKDVDDALKRLGSKQVPVILIIPNGDFEKMSVFRGSYTKDNIIGAIEK